MKRTTFPKIILAVLLAIISVSVLSSAVYAGKRRQARIDKRTGKNPPTTPTEPEKKSEPDWPCPSIPQNQYNKCGCNPRSQQAIDLASGLGLKQNIQASIEKCVSSSFDITLKKTSSAKLEGCLKSEAKLNSDIVKAFTAKLEKESPVKDDEVARWEARCFDDRVPPPEVCSDVNAERHKVDRLVGAELKSCMPGSDNILIKFSNEGNNNDWCEVVLHDETTGRVDIFKTGRMNKSEKNEFKDKIYSYAGHRLKLQIWSPGAFGVPGDGGGYVKLTVPSTGDLTINMKCGKN